MNTFLGITWFKFGSPKIDSIAGTKLFNSQTVICNTFPTNLLSDMQQSTNSKHQVLKY